RPPSPSCTTAASSPPADTTRSSPTRPYEPPTPASPTCLRSEVPMLRVENLVAGYGTVTVLHDVTLTVPTGHVVTVTGLSGAGKTTLLHTIAGLLCPTGGVVSHRGIDLHRLPTHDVARAGVALVPQGRRVFGSLTVAEHLTIAASRRPGPWTTQ